MNKGNDGFIRDRRLDFVKAGDHPACLVGERQALAQVIPEKALDVLGQGRWSLGLGLEGAGEEAAFGRFLHHVGAGRDPDAAARQLALQLRDDGAVRRAHEADQRLGRQLRARDDAGPLGDVRFMAGGRQRRSVLVVPRAAG